MLRKFANNASNVNAVYRQSTRYSCFTEESWASIGLEFGAQWMGIFTATLQSVSHNRKPDVYFINVHVKILVSTISGIQWRSQKCELGGGFPPLPPPSHPFPLSPLLPLLTGPGSVTPGNFF